MDENRRQTACFTGHRILKEPTAELKRRVSAVVEELIQREYRYFSVGGARGFDALASEAILKLRERDPRIHLVLVLPFENQYSYERNWSEEEIAQHHRLKEQASKVIMLAPSYDLGLYYRRNRHLVDNASTCVAYMTRENSGTGYTVRYARSKGVQVVNIAGIG